MPKEFDIVLMGATSFVGQITARRFAEQGQDQAKGLRIGLAGRSASKLNVLIAELKEIFPAIEFTTKVYDSMNDTDMTALAASTKVVVSTVGPYELYGEPLVKACAEQGTHYCDLTGEPQFIHSMLKKYEATANASGACIVHCCGFDSIPSDLGTYYLQQQAKSTLGDVCVEVDMRVKAASGGLSGGTIASLITVVKKARANPDLRKVLFDPYALCPKDLGVKQTFIGKVQADWVTDQWVAPFLMASINSKIVMRSAQLLPEMYPSQFRYNEGMLGGRGKKGKRRAKMISAGLMAITVGAALGPTRWFLERFVLPKPGEGPSVQEQKDGFFVVQVYGKTQKGEVIAVQVSGDQDPGYGSTSKMLSQAAIALCTELPRDQAGGFWTPASLLGESLLTRLPKYAGFEFKVIQS